MSLQHPTVSWANGSNIYEVNLRQYTAQGTFLAFANHLPRLKAMGVDVLWFMPITPISVKKRQGSLGSYYACSSYTDTNPEFGSIAQFQYLVRLAHENGMRVIIDWVANHTGCDHQWMYTNPEWFLKNEQGQFYDRNGWIDVADLDYSQPAMRKAMIEAMLFWVKTCGIDGFRCDMAHLVPLDFWADARNTIEAHCGPLFWLAETDDAHYLQVFDASYAWRFMHTSEKYMKGEDTMASMAYLLEQYAAMPPKAMKLLFTSNHDENSWNGTEFEKYGKAALPFAALTLTWPGIPLVYSGQEVGNHKRLQFFDKDVIDWPLNTSIAIEAMYTALLHLRKRNKALQWGATVTLLSQHNQVLTYLLTQAEHKVFVVLNVSHHEKQRVTVEHAQLAGNYLNVISGIQFELRQREQFELQAGEFMVYEAL